ATPLRTLHDLMGRAPAGTGHWLAALDFYVSAPKEVVIIGPRDDPATAALLQTVYGGFHPNKVLVGAQDAQNPDSAGDRGLPLLEARGMVDGKPTAYVCQNYACQLPVTTPEELAAQLEG
ncbi:MAG: thioredoxin domain-containing protein, partial [Chloroflexi bacterium]|nr:thioredoxin domain-containing protein [Chloroflexota bacterium]